ARPIEFVSLFNGKDLTGWTTVQGGAGNWKVVDGAITCEGAASYLFSSRDDYADFHLKVEARINKAGDSGIFFRTGKKPSNPGGFEAQINIAGPSDWSMGSLWGLKKATEPPPPPDIWFPMEIIAQGDRIRILVDGKQTVDYTDPTRRL